MEIPAIFQEVHSRQSIINTINNGGTAMNEAHTIAGYYAWNASKGNEIVSETAFIEHLDSLAQDGASINYDEAVKAANKFQEAYCA